MRSTLEKALIALLSEDKDQAEALFHDYLISRSRQVNESLVQGGTFVLNESDESTFAVDATFAESDLPRQFPFDTGHDGNATNFDEARQEGLEAYEAGVEHNPYDPETQLDLYNGFESGQEAGRDNDDDAWGENEVDESTGSDSMIRDDGWFSISTEHMLSPEDRAEYDAKLASLGYHVAGDYEWSIAGGDDCPDGIIVQSMEMRQDPQVAAVLAELYGAGAYDDSDFEDLGESLVNDLKKVEVIKDEGGVTGGDKVKVNKTSPGLQPKINDRMKGTPAETTPDEHNGFAMEKAPKVAKVPKYENNK